MTTSERTPEPEFYGPQFLRLDLPRGRAQPTVWRWIIGTIVAVAGSLAACYVLALGATAMFPNLAGYQHFQFGDYSRLTIIGVIGACIGWPVVTWFTSSARRLYLWLAIIVDVVSLAPDAWILHQGQPPLGVATLIAMHIALGIVTYPAMVFIAPQRPARPGVHTASG